MLTSLPVEDVDETEATVEDARCAPVDEQAFLPNRGRQWRVQLLGDRPLRRVIRFEA